ncbi:cryptochrome/photolyase family protein [Rhizobium tumorigenes]|uniref:cryptochrome/photolyase family protein n=1 Tax=Rhizobium tumorigenes TaxID=2041385 RepID=UPI00241E22B3|nr:deoxyribodipyrimidine photo-lyase [Rhizobium tumorigenes]WFS02173.1 deoxyribodipyrimidine photo-lyase [Rhizobium tumorigenes]
MTAVTKASGCTILWFRKDLRLDDNLALHAACEKGRPIIPFYIREPDKNGTGPLGAAQRWWLHHSLTALQASLRELGSDLMFASGDALSVLLKLIETSGATGVVWNRRYDPAGIAVDTEIKRQLAERGIVATSFAGQLLHEPSKLMTGGGTPYRVYTPFWRALEGRGEPPEPLDAPKKITAPEAWPHSEPLSDWKLLPTKPNWALSFSDVWVPGEAPARARLDDFVDEALTGYKADRDFPAKPATSMLSPHLALGEISPARIWYSTRNLPKSTPQDDVIHFRKELAWRDFSYHLLFHFPALPSANWNKRFDAFEWRTETDLFEDWTQGRTGYPIVDAGMRQLWKHGWMHNRVRMIVASFLIKDLLIDWRQGEEWFRDTLVDADPASNAASWQWVAGSGADASPFFRIFNPILQGEKFDPEGTYVREFVPELAELGNKYIHRPFEAPVAVLDKAGIALGKTYPNPIVDHAKARDRALKAYSAVKDAA